MQDTPQHSPDMIYLYSNYHGNYFVLNEEGIDLFEHEARDEVVSLV